MNASRPLKMRLNLNVLQHLGLNLYSNVPAVLSEIVANAWDADAEKVRVDWDKNTGCIVIEDDGIGMTRDDIIDRFLLVGYQRRTDRPGLTSKGRRPMGRKGIGKLSLFSIASEIVVNTVRHGQNTALRMRLDAIKSAIEDGNNEYEPEELSISGIASRHGTRITLRDLRKRLTIRTDEALRRRLARRFSIIGPKYGFGISVNDIDVSPADRGFYDRLQYIWTYGDQSSILSLCKNSVETTGRDSHIALRDETQPDKTQLTVDGWLGTVYESSQLRDEHGENLNRIAIFVRGKMAQEDLLGDLTERGIYANYLIGELRVDGLDTDHGEDSATSGRQRIVEDDPRYVALKDFVRSELKFLEKRWSELRVEAGAKKATEIPEVKAWIDGLPGSISTKAKKWLGKINRINVGRPTERLQLMKHAVLAFEFYRCNQNLEELDKISDENFEPAIRVFQDLDGLEATWYGQIVRQRIGIIRALQKKVDENSRERIIQEYIFDHLWLLDPSWERAQSSETMETRMESLFDKIDAGLSQEERNARLDIQYRETAGKHVVVELKRPGRTVSVFKLAEQIEKYRSGMIKILRQIDGSHDPMVEFVCLLSKPPTEWDNPNGQKLVEDVLGAQNARYVNYDSLLENAFQAYSDYQEKTKKIERLGNVIGAIENYVQD